MNYRFMLLCFYACTSFAAIQVSDQDIAGRTLFQNAQACAYRISEKVGQVASAKIPAALLCAVRDNIAEYSGGAALAPFGAAAGNALTNQVISPILQNAGYLTSALVGYEAFKKVRNYLDQTSLHSCTKLVVQTLTGAAVTYGLCALSDQAVERATPAIDEFSQTVGAYAGMVIGGFIAIRVFGSEETLITNGAVEEYTETYPAKCIRCSVGDHALTQLLPWRPTGISGFLFDQATGSLFFNSTDIYNFTKKAKARELLHGALSDQPVQNLLGTTFLDYFAETLSGNLNSLLESVLPEELLGQAQTLKIDLSTALEEYLIVGLSDYMKSLTKGESNSFLNFDLVSLLHSKDLSDYLMKCSQNQFEDFHYETLLEKSGLKEEMKNHFLSVIKKEMHNSIYEYWINHPELMEFVVESFDSYLGSAKKVKTLQKSLYQIASDFEKDLLGFQVTKSANDLNPMMQTFLLHAPFVITYIILKKSSDLLSQTPQPTMSRKAIRTFYKTMSELIFFHYQEALPSPVKQTNVLGLLKNELRAQINHASTIQGANN